MFMQQVSGFLQFVLSGRYDDKLVSKLNSMAFNMSALGSVLLDDYHFPSLIFNLAYVPCLFLVLLINVLQHDIHRTIVTLAVIYAFLMFMGAICTLIFIFVRGFFVYHQSRSQNSENAQQQM